MNYEKAYKEALEKAKKELATCSSMNCDEARQIIRFFPELAEDEDKRIVKRLLTLVKILDPCFFKGDNPSKKECLAWLEKQKENPKSAISIPADCASNAKCKDKCTKQNKL